MCTTHGIATYAWHMGRGADADKGTHGAQQTRGMTKAPTAKKEKPLSPRDEYIGAIVQMEEVLSEHFLVASDIRQDILDEMLQVSLPKRRTLLSKHKCEILRDMLGSDAATWGGRGRSQTNLFRKDVKEAIESAIDGKERAALSLAATSSSLLLEEILPFVKRGWIETDPSLTRSEKSERMKRITALANKSASFLGHASDILYEECVRIDSELEHDELDEETREKMQGIRNLYRATLSMLKHVKWDKVPRWEFNRHAIIHYPYEYSKKIDHHEELIVGLLILMAWLSSR